MNTNHRNKLLSALLGIAMLAFGALFFLNPMRQLLFASRLLAVAFGVLLLAHAAKAALAIFRRDNMLKALLQVALDGVALVLLLALGGMGLSRLMPLLAALWVMGSGVMKLVLAAQYRASDMASWRMTALVGALLLLAGALALASLGLRVAAVSFVLGGVFIVYGAARLLELFVPRAHVSLPRPGDNSLFGRAFRPQRTLKFLRKLQSSHPFEPGDTPDTECEIYVHLTDNPDTIFGHVDMSLDGVAYSYGNYDSHTQKLGGAVSDGVLAVVARGDYLRFCIERERKLLLAYRVRLTPEQHGALSSYLSAMIARSDAFAPDALTRSDPATRDPAAVLWRATGCEFYKPAQKRFHRYFAIGTNCVRMVDDALAASCGFGHRLAGVLMPGDYIQVLEKELRGGRGFIVSRAVYGEQAAHAARASAPGAP